MTTTTEAGEQPSERERFEAWASSHGWNATHLAKSKVDSRYAWSGLNSAWEVWQAARASAGSSRGNHDR